MEVSCAVGGAVVGDELFVRASSLLGEPLGKRLSLFDEFLSLGALLLLLLGAVLVGSAGGLLIVGDFVGISSLGFVESCCDGAIVGPIVGPIVVGLKVGPRVGNLVGIAVVGAGVGLVIVVGATIVSVGSLVGCSVGRWVGRGVGISVGVSVGCLVGEYVNTGSGRAGIGSEKKLEAKLLYLLREKMLLLVVEEDAAVAVAVAVAVIEVAVPNLFWRLCPGRRPGREDATPYWRSRWLFSTASNAGRRAVTTTSFSFNTICPPFHKLRALSMGETDVCNVM